MSTTMSVALPASFYDAVIFPSDMLKDAICRGMRCGIREGRAGLDKVRWLEARYAAALWSHLKGRQVARVEENTDEMCFAAIELVEIYADSGIVDAFERMTGEMFSAHDLLQRLAKNVAFAAKNETVEE